MMRVMGNRIGLVLLGLALLAGALWWWGGSEGPAPIDVRGVDGEEGAAVAVEQVRLSERSGESPADTDAVRSEQSQSGTLSIRVVDGETGEPVPGAEVRVFGDQERRAPAFVRSKIRAWETWDWVQYATVLHADDEGRFAIDRSASIVARMGNRSGFLAIDDKRLSGETPLPDLVIWPETSLTVRLVDRLGGGVPGIRVLARLVDGSDPGTEGGANPWMPLGKTDGSGVFHDPLFHAESARFPTLRGEGVLEVRPSMTRFGLEARQLPNPLRRTESLTWTLPEHGSLRVEIVDGLGEHLELSGSLAVELFDAQESLGLRSLNFTRGAGTLEHIPLGTRLRLVRQPPYLSEMPEWIPGPTALGEVVLLRPKVVHDSRQALYVGRILDADGHPLARTHLEFPEDQLVASVYEDGQFTLAAPPLPPGEHPVRSRLKSWMRGLVQFPPATAGTIVPLGDTVLRDTTGTTQVLGRVRVLLDGYPFAEDFAYRLEGFDATEGSWDVFQHQNNREGGVLELSAATDLQRFRIGVPDGPWFVSSIPVEFVRGADVTLELSSGSSLELITTPGVRQLPRPRARRIDREDGVRFARQDDRFLCKGLVAGTYAIEWPPTIFGRSFRAVAEVQVPARGKTELELDLRPYLLVVEGDKRRVSQVAARSGDRWSFEHWSGGSVHMVLGEDVEQIALIGPGLVPQLAAPRGTVELELQPFAGGLQLALATGQPLEQLLVLVERATVLLPDETEIRWNGQESTHPVSAAGSLELPLDMPGRYSLRVQRMNQSEILLEQEVLVSDPSALTPVQATLPDPAASPPNKGR